tara:strand:+ start:473 stop:742 length:270 start_codon:yes stop_codon:yes gene_type:complete
MYEFKINKSPDSTMEEFESAMFCAKNCIDSILQDKDLSAKVSDQKIIVQATDQEQAIDITATELQEKIKGCFCDSSGKLYPEFTKIVAP